MTTNSKPLPSRTYLRECFEYDLISGEAYWLERPIDHFDSYRAYTTWNSRFAWTKVGSKQKDGYLHAKINGSQYKIHRLFWVWWYGLEPLIIDHIDRDRSNNRIVNLRSVTPRQNTHNSKIRITNKTGYKGVESLANGWRATTCLYGNKIHLGIYYTKEEAAEAIKEFHR